MSHLMMCKNLEYISQQHNSFYNNTEKDHLKTPHYHEIFRPHSYFTPQKQHFAWIRNVASVKRSSSHKLSSNSGGTKMFE